MKRVLVLAALVLMVGCGSTVSTAARRAAGGSSGGLGASSASEGDSAASPDAAATESATAASGGSSATSGGRAAATAGNHAGSASVGGGSTGPASGPIEVGIVRTGTSNAAAYGASLGNSVTESDVDDALVAAFNDQGGVAGRKIVPVYADTDTGSTSWDADFEAACAKFTQDHKVAAVLGYVFNHDQAFEGCLAKKSVPHLSTTFNVPDAEELRNYPLLMALGTPRIERRSQEKIDGGLATGVLTKASKLGVVIDQCPGTERAWTNVTKPYILSKGLTIASEFRIGCAHGAGDAAAIAGQAGNLVLQFRTAQVDRMMVDAVSEGPGILVLANAAEAQNWHPWYVVSSLANAAVLGGQMPPDQAANIHGYGWMPAQDVNPPQWPSTNATQQRCIAMLKQKGVTLKAAVDYLYAFNLCDAFFIYEIALKATHGRTDGPSVVAAVEALGTSYLSALNLEGKDTFSHAQHDAPSLARYFAWDTGCSCFTYRPTTFRIA